MNNLYAVPVSCPKSTRNMAWVDGNSIGLGCLGFSKRAGYRSHSPYVTKMCKKAHSKAHLVEIYNEKQVRFMMSVKVQKHVASMMGQSVNGWGWWIGGELKHGKWYWTHSNKPIKYVPRIGSNGSFDKSYRYLRLYLTKTTAYVEDQSNHNCQMICQISPLLIRAPREYFI